jgi:hypothetical protein
MLSLTFLVNFVFVAHIFSRNAALCVGIGLRELLVGKIADIHAGTLPLHFHHHRP